MLWYNTTLMDKFGYQRADDMAAVRRQLGEEVAKQHPGYVIGTIGDT